MEAQLPGLPLKISERRALLTFGDILLVNGATLVALWLGALRSHWPFSLQFLISHIYWFLFLTVLWLILASVNDLYSLRIAADAFSSAFATLKVTSQALLVYFLIYFLSPPQSLPRHVMVFFAILSFPFLIPWRSVYAIVLNATPFQRQAIIVGAGRAGRIIVQAIRDNLASEYQLVGYIDDDLAKQGQAIEGLPVIGTSRDLVFLVKAKNISEGYYSGHSSHSARDEGVASRSIVNSIYHVQPVFTDGRDIAANSTECLGTGAGTESA